MNKKKRLAIILGIIAFLAFGIYMVVTNGPQKKIQQKTHSMDITTTEFISQVTPQAQREQRQYNIPASIIIAQAGTESNWGRSTLAAKYNNLFGVKGYKGEKRVKMVTTEYVDGKKIHVKQYFRVYDNWDESIKQHTKLIINGTTDNPKRYQNVRTKSYKTAAKNLQKDGYATDPKYAKKLISAIKKYHLDQYDN